MITYISNLQERKVEKSPKKGLNGSKSRRNKPLPHIPCFHDFWGTYVVKSLNTKHRYKLPCLITKTKGILKSKIGEAYIYINQNVVRKIHKGNNKKPPISQQAIICLKVEINKPLAIFKQKNKSGFNVLTFAKEKCNGEKGSYLLIALEPKTASNPPCPQKGETSIILASESDADSGRKINNFYEIRSVYVRENFSDYEKWKNQGLLLYKKQGFKFESLAKNHH